jgi:hypothetical protein
LEAHNRELSIKSQKREAVTTKSCSPIRITFILLIGFFGSLYFALSSKFGQMDGEDKLLSLVIMLMAGLPLLHSFLKGLTLGRHGVVTLTNDAFTFSMMQLFYSFVLFYIISSTIVWW